MVANYAKVNLEQYLKMLPWTLTFEQVMDIFLQILLGVQYLHEAGISYLNICLQNIFYIDRELKISLFGYPQAQVGDNCHFVANAFMAPETFNRKSEPFKSDAYSLGAILYYIINRKAPDLYEI